MISTHRATCLGPNISIEEWYFSVLKCFPCFSLISLNSFIKKNNILQISFYSKPSFIIIKVTHVLRKMGKKKVHCFHDTQGKRKGCMMAPAEYMRTLSLGTVTPVTHRTNIRKPFHLCHWLTVFLQASHHGLHSEI